MFYRAFLSNPPLTVNGPSTTTSPSTSFTTEFQREDTPTESIQPPKKEQQQQAPQTTHTPKKRQANKLRIGRTFVDWSGLTSLERYSPQYSPVFSFVSVYDDDDEAGKLGQNQLSLAMPSIQVHLVIDSTSSAPFREKKGKTDSNSTTNGTTTSSSSTVTGSDDDPVNDEDYNVRGRARQVPEFLLDGITRSPFMRLTGRTSLEPMSQLETKFFTTENSDGLPLLYLVDWGSMNRDCHRLRVVLDTVENQREERKNEDDESNEGSLLLPYVLLVDFSSSPRLGNCTFLMHTFGKTDKGRVRFSKRSIVQGRYYNFTTTSVHPGSLLPPLHSNGATTTGTGGDSLLPILHSPLVLRESFVVTQLAVLTNQSTSVLDHHRPIDVTCFWTRGDYSHYGFYRREVAESVKKLHHSTPYDHIKIEARVQLSYSDKKQMEDGGIVQYKYVQDLLSTKIVVISQRDEWEDNYRLMESLASGALVLSDPMIAPPAGLQNKVNIVFYPNPRELRNLIRYYLHPDHESKRIAIAQKGFELAMGRHRSWHRMEELLFGEPLTNVNLPFEVAPTADTIVAESESLIIATAGRW
jgi:hypothetical protein